MNSSKGHQDGRHSGQSSPNTSTPPPSQQQSGFFPSSSSFPDSPPSSQNNNNGGGGNTFNSFFNNLKSNTSNLLGGKNPLFDQIININNSLQDLSQNLCDMNKSTDKTCNSCNVPFNIFLRKKRCNKCALSYCSHCMNPLVEPKNGRFRPNCFCRRCFVFGQTLNIDMLNNLRVRDLKWFLTSRNIPFDHCNEKRELIELILELINNNANRSTPTNADTFSRHEQRRHSADNVNNTNINDTPTPSSQHASQSSSTTNLFSTSSTAYSSSSASTATTFTSAPNLSFNLNDITSEESIRSLTVRQLKLLLTRNYVDFKGCVEREELIRKVVLLWQDRQQTDKLKDDLEKNPDVTIGDESTCKICMVNVIDCVLLECGHMLTCTECGKLLTECPICRQFVSRVVHVFKA